MADNVSVATKRTLHGSEEPDIESNPNEISDIIIDELPKEAEKDAGPPPPDETAKIPPPDTGYAWVMVFCCFLIHAIIISPMYSFGVYSRYWVESATFPGVSLTVLTITGAASAALCPGVGPIAGRLVDMYGGRYICLGGVLGCFASFLLASFSTQYWQILLTQGFLFGAAQGFAFFAFMTELPRWFAKKRGLAVGLAVAGTGIGGFAWSPFTNYMITTLSVNWAQRITGFIQLAFGLVCTVLFRSRSKPSMANRKILDFSFFKNVQFTMMWLTQFSAFWGYFNFFFLVSAYAGSVGISQAQGALIVGMTNLGSTIGRILVGQASDRLGHFNAFTVCALFASLALLVIWPFAKSLGTLIFCGMFFAFFSGGFVSLASTCVAEIVGPATLGSAIGLVYGAGAIADMAGPPIAGLLIQSGTNPDGTTWSNYVPMMMFSGATMLASTVFVGWVRMDRAKWKLVARV